MPHPLTATLLASAAILGFLGSPIAAIIFVSVSLLIETARFLLDAAEPPQTTEVLVRSGEEPPEQGRTTLLRG